ncbi:MAG: hypothetical protein JXA98_07130, partial [Methanosarcinaceae archaeon]|nr:hypothetical protein [Methanosarcinaceae archaeon]
TSPEHKNNQYLYTDWQGETMPRMTNQEFWCRVFSLMHLATKTFLNLLISSQDTIVVLKKIGSTIIVMC